MSIRLLLDWIVIKEKALYLLLILAPFTLLIVNWLVNTLIKPDTTEKFTVALLFAYISMFSMFTLYSQKQLNLKKFKLEQWYYTFPVTSKMHVYSDVILILVSHMIGFIIWGIFNLLDHHTEYIIIGLMTAGISLMLNFYYIYSVHRLNGNFNMVFIIAYFLCMLFIMCFHSMLIINDYNYNLNLNLNESKAWNFYLYQLPYIMVVMGLCIGFIVTLVLTKRKTGFQHLK
ncbi:hypothetical protein ERX37_05815 [Macrococcus hajekii]|uniref:Uncharacterized protein n=1 Tax=Macrococcus hajekii TaxID=198482 RepID=A0A4R6BJC1_9STAP|nr:hypothetical protein [Macrococcus hajekii]TDM01728.1 hypothetical protein ERX37_05815 [Macrococcus hajekii]GGB06893.1 hypothetical protein GCM10007190_13700 [Macrococcus hajekii]